MMDIEEILFKSKNEYQIMKDFNKEAQIRKICDAQMFGCFAVGEDEYLPMPQSRHFAEALIEEQNRQRFNEGFVLGSIFFENLSWGIMHANYINQCPFIGKALKCRITNEPCKFYEKACPVNRYQKFKPIFKKLAQIK